MTPQQLAEIEAAAQAALKRGGKQAVVPFKADIITALIADLRAANESLASKYAFQVPEHLDHLPSVMWHDTCGYCLPRRVRGGSGVAVLDEARAENKRLQADVRAKTEANEKLQVQLEDLRLRLIEASNPGIDMAEVRAIRAERDLRLAALGVEG